MSPGGQAQQEQHPSRYAPPEVARQPFLSPVQSHQRGRTKRWAGRGEGGVRRMGQDSKLVLGAEGRDHSGDSIRMKLACPSLAHPVVAGPTPELPHALSPLQLAPSTLLPCTLFLILGVEGVGEPHPALRDHF